MPWLLLTIGFLLGCPPRAHCETAEESLKAYESKIFSKGYAFVNEEISALSKKIAQKYGVNIIEPILDRSKSWKGEEPLIYMGIIMNLPPHQAISELEKYLSSKNREKALLAREFLIEMEAYLTDEHKRVSKILEKYPSKDFPY